MRNKISFYNVELSPISLNKGKKGIIDIKYQRNLEVMEMGKK